MTIDNKHTSYLLVLFSIFILFFITLWQYDSLQENLDNKNQAELKLIENDEKLKKLNGDSNNRMLKNFIVVLF